MLVMDQAMHIYNGNVSNWPAVCMPRSRSIGMLAASKSAIPGSHSFVCIPIKLITICLCECECVCLQLAQLTSEHLNASFQYFAYITKWPDGLTSAATFSSGVSVCSVARCKWTRWRISNDYLGV